MRKFIDLTGQSFGNLTAIRREMRLIYSKFQWAWLCQCDCGNSHYATTGSLRSGNTKSCGCLQPQAASHAKTTHGASGSKLYKTWKGMIQRCTNSACPAYKNYGGRGITVCDKWRNSFESFRSDVGDPPTERHSLDRINVEGNYCPENCRWATVSEQHNNTRANHRVTFQGETLTIAQWSARTGIDRFTIKDRLTKLGWSPERALTEPVVSRNNPVITYNGITKPLREWAKEFGIRTDTLTKRIVKHGWTIEKALHHPVGHRTR